MIRVTDKFIGKTDHPNYIQCQTLDDFVLNITQNSISREIFIADILNYLKTEGLIDSDVTDPIFYGGYGAVSVNESWSNEEQTITRERIFNSRAEYDELQAIKDQLDYSLFLPEILYDIEFVGIEEI